MFKSIQVNFILNVCLSRYSTGHCIPYEGNTRPMAKKEEKKRNQVIQCWRFYLESLLIYICSNCPRREFSTGSNLVDFMCMCIAPWAVLKIIHFSAFSVSLDSKICLCIKGYWA